MDRAHLTKLYTTAEFADCVIVSAQNQKFKAHRFVLSQYPHLTELLDDDDRIHLTESTEVTERLLRWIYGVDWPEIDVQPTRLGVGKELMDIMSLCDAAQKVNLTTDAAPENSGAANQSRSTTSRSSGTRRMVQWAGCWARSPPLRSGCTSYVISLTRTRVPALCSAPSSIASSRSCQERPRAPVPSGRRSPRPRRKSRRRHRGWLPGSRRPPFSRHRLGSRECLFSYERH